jgi:hypothetical protein
VARAAGLRGGIGVVLLLGAAYAVVRWGPWDGPIILTLSTAHGIHIGDLLALPLLALAVAIGQSGARGRPRWARSSAGRWALPASGVLLGALLLLAPVQDTIRDEPLLPAGGGTFGGAAPMHADGPRAGPVNRWSHLAVTFDGRRLWLYVNGSHVSSRAEMSTPVASAETSRGAGLVGAYAFDKGSGSLAADASGNGNTGAIIGAHWTSRGRFGGALHFDGDDDKVRIPGSESLDLQRGMTLSGWSRPGESQDGWRTILHRQTDAYFLAAGGGTYQVLGTLDDALAALIVGTALWFCLLLAGTAGRRAGGRRRSWWGPVALFLAGSLLDSALTPSGTLFGPTLLAGWFALTASHRAEAVSTSVITVVFTAVTLVSLAGEGGLDLARDDGGIARSVALGVLFMVAGLVSAARPRPS